MKIYCYDKSTSRKVRETVISEETIAYLASRIPSAIYFFDPDELDPQRRYMFCYGTQRKELDFVEERHQNYVIDNEEVKDIATSWPQFIYFYADLDTSSI